jgi:hypothetical protein
MEKNYCPNCQNIQTLQHYSLHLQINMQNVVVPPGFKVILEGCVKNLVDNFCKDFGVNRSDANEYLKSIVASNVGTSAVSKSTVSTQTYPDDVEDEYRRPKKHAKKGSDLNESHPDFIGIPPLSEEGSVVTDNTRALSKLKYEELERGELVPFAAISNPYHEPEIGYCEEINEYGCKNLIVHGSMFSEYMKNEKPSALNFRYSREYISGICNAGIYVKDYFREGNFNIRVSALYGLIPFLISHSKGYDRSISVSAVLVNGHRNIFKVLFDWKGKQLYPDHKVYLIKEEKDILVKLFAFIYKHFPHLEIFYNK